MKALIIVAHGSRKKESNQEVLSLIRAVEYNTPHTFDRVAGAFLQFGAPGLEEQIETLAKEAVTKIVVFPFFMAAGNHISSDIPGIIEKARTTYPAIEFVVTAHLGKVSGIETIIHLEAEKY